MNIILAVTNDLATDQRVDRSCAALAEAGHEVTLVGRRLPESPRLAPRSYRTQRMRLLFRRSALFYAEYNLRLWFKLIISRADVFYANDTDTLLACCCAARLRKKKLFFDAHELFPEVPELVHKPRIRSVWQWIERHCLPHVDAAVTVCQSVADEYHRRYGVEMAVVRNVPEKLTEPLDTIPHEGTVLLYQGAVNVGRGVHELIDVMRLLPGCRLVIAGNGDLEQPLRQYAATLPWCDRIDFRGRVLPQELHKLTRQADLGLCLLEDLGLNYRYALPNRLADFAQARVPLLATDFPEIRRIISKYQIGTLVPPCPVDKEGDDYEAYVGQLADRIQETIAYWQKLPADERKQHFDLAVHDLCWQNEKNILLDTIEQLR